MYPRRFMTLAEFWPYYVSQHANPLNRKLHFWGTHNLLFWLALSVWRRDFKLAVFAVVSSYAFAWIGHFFIEQNRPATLDYPVLSALGELQMYLMTWQGTIDAEIAKYAPPQSVAPDATL